MKSKTLNYLSKNKNRGFSIIESLVSLSIIGLTVSAVIGIIITTNKIAAKRTSVSNAAILVGNEVERLRKYENMITLPNDTVYIDTVNGIPFEIKTKRIINDSFAQDTAFYYQEFLITAKRVWEQDFSCVKVRLLQGYLNVNE
jgi:prepilin-type N-terminal cleavage/methylation domain-containing protein